MKPTLPAFFGCLRARVAADRAADLEPQARFTPEWSAWLNREVARNARLTEINASEALTTDPRDPAPTADLGFDRFILWMARQRARRTPAGRAVA